MWVYCILVWSACICTCVSITHSFPCPPRSLSQSLPPCFDLFLLFSPTRSQSQKHAHAPIFPPTHAVGTGESLTSSTVWHGVMQRSTKIGAAPLPNGVSMATTGARPCHAVSNKHRIFKPLKINELCVVVVGWGSTKKHPTCGYYILTMHNIYYKECNLLHTILF